MLFDLRGKRRRAVQATYLTLAVLMGGGLVLFGIGGDVQGGLADIFSGSGGSDSAGNEQLQKRIEKLEAAAQRNPNDTGALKALVVANFQLANAEIPPGAAELPDNAREDMRAAGRAWTRYLAAIDGKPDPAAANYALQAFDALNQPKDAVKAATILAEDSNDANGYIQVVRYATLAGDTRLADLAEQRALDLAPKAQRDLVKQNIKAAKTPPQQQQTQPQG